MVNLLQWNNSILMQNSENRVVKPKVIMPSKDENLIAEGTHIILHWNDSNAYIVYTLDGSIPWFTNGIKYDSQRFPIVVPADILSYTVKFVACKPKMVDSEIWVRKFKVTKEVPLQNKRNIVMKDNMSRAMRAVHDEEPIGELNLGLETPSSSNMTPQHPGRLSSVHNVNYMPSMGYNNENFSDKSEDI